MLNKDFKLLLLSKLVNKQFKGVIGGMTLIGAINDSYNDKYIVLIENKLFVTNKEFKKLGKCSIANLNKYYNKITFFNNNSLLYYLLEIEAINKHNALIEEKLMENEGKAY